MFLTQDHPCVRVVASEWTGGPVDALVSGMYEGRDPMSPIHVSWGGIELLHNVVITLNHLHNLGAPLPSLRYRGKVKLHGTNCAVQVTPEGVFAQSRTGLLSLPSNDHRGFAAWVKNREHYFKTCKEGITIFGEWAGPGVEKGMAVSHLPHKVFAVFAIQEGYGEDAQIIFEPEVIARMLPDVDDMYILPWVGDDFSLDFGSRESLESATAMLNDIVVQIEKEDPWIKAEFGISGLGEGIVLYPVSYADGSRVSHSPDVLTTLMFKAKGEKHRTAGHKAPVQIDATVVASVEEFVKLMVTDARLAQGLSVVCPDGPDIRNMGAYLSWVAADVEKESKAELEASGLTWTQVSKAVQSRARDWFKANL